MLEFQLSGKGVKVFLSTEKISKRPIGTITNNTLYKFVKESNLQRSITGFGFNQELIDSNKFNYINVQYAGFLFSTTVDKVKEANILRKYKEYEKQYFMPLKEFNGYETYKKVRSN